MRTLLVGLLATLPLQGLADPGVPGSALRRWQ
jgi:hypothetical protein